MPNKTGHIVIVGIVGLVGVAALALHTSSGLGLIPALGKDELKRVEARYVCMIDDKSFDKEQTPIEINGRTFYGCCEKCNEALRESDTARAAVDPVTGHTVDKTKAVIGALPDGTVRYFETEENLQRFTTDPDS
jgi:YHS domain-containing protein